MKTPAASLIITIDTEEEGLWMGKFRGAGNTVNNVAGIPEFQSICDNYALKPTYLINSPVVSDAAAADTLETIAARDACEIGCHIHPWNTPPVVENVTGEQSYLCNLPLEEQRARLETVTAQIAERFGTPPTSFRAGRYGLNADGMKILKDLGYIVDSSVCPFMDYSADGGPDFRGAPWIPYHVENDICVPAKSGNGLLEVPVSFGYSWANFNTAHAIYERTAHKYVRALRLRAIAERSGLLNKLKFSPEKSNFQSLRKLANVYSHQGAPCLVMMFHSSSLVPGMSPYVPSAEHLERFLRTIDATIKYCLESLGMRSATLSDFAREYARREARSAKS